MNLPLNELPPEYTTTTARKNTVAIWGGSRDSEIFKPYFPICDKFVKELLSQGKKVVHGCGSNGILGCIYRAAYKYSAKNDKDIPTQSLALLVKPRWGDEDLEHCLPVAEASSERERVGLFRQMTDNFVIFPGSIATLQEVSTLIVANYYNTDDCKNIYLIDDTFYEEFIAMYDKLYKNDLIKCAPDELFHLAKNANEVLEMITASN